MRRNQKDFLARHSGHNDLGDGLELTEELFIDAYPCGSLGGGGGGRRWLEVGTVCGKGGGFGRVDQDLGDSASIWDEELARAVGKSVAA